ncbi:unnamed protein product [Tilletia laevis]|uniref:Uncharacterized protein n=1 Tax=Tilletia laevis TaxID=157183 RepID=A0A9N8M2R7_9BASI|nr:hypothetical protein CF328_g4814 [Tilletia controversa]CAD6921374.1 unnamed protein product [Tilletia laevis]CAD6939699.1 unnamed protein product [Tilletia laevis]
MKIANAPFLILLSVLMGSASATHDEDVLMCIKVAKAKSHSVPDKGVYNKCMKCAQCEHKGNQPAVPQITPTTVSTAQDISEQERTRVY